MGEGVSRQACSQRPLTVNLHDIMRDAAAEGRHGAGACCTPECGRRRLMGATRPCRKRAVRRRGRRSLARLCDSSQFKLEKTMRTLYQISINIFTNTLNTMRTRALFSAPDGRVIALRCSVLTVRPPLCRERSRHWARRFSRMNRATRSFPTACASPIRGRGSRGFLPAASPNAPWSHGL